MANEELLRAAVRGLRDIDSRRVFWVDLGIATRKDATADQVAWDELDWDEIRADIDRWLDELDPDDRPAQLNWPITEALLLVFQARGRSVMARGWREKPSLVLAEAPTPELHFADGGTGSLYSLSLDEVHGLGSGERRLALELPSHREVWEMLYGQMQALGFANTADMDPTVLEPFAFALGLKEPPPGLGDFDEGWRAIYGAEFPLIDDPRDPPTTELGDEDQQ